jgi:hypothetical protein
MAVTEGMGEILDRTKENLGATDIMIVRTRRRLLSAIKDLEKGTSPPLIENPEAAIGRRSGCFVRPATTDWYEAYREEVEGALALEKREGSGLAAPV